MKKLTFALAVSMIIHSAAFAASGVVELKVVKAEGLGNGCKMTIEAVNKSDISFNSFSPKIRFVDDKGNHIDTKSVPVNNIRPGKTFSDWFQIQNAACSEIASGDIEQIEFCKVNGDYMKGCESLISLPAGMIKLTK